LAISPNGDLYIADTYNDVVEKVTPSGKLSIVAGLVANPGLPTIGKATRSQLNEPTGLALSAGGDLYIADLFNNLVEKVTPSGKLSVVAGVPGARGAPTAGKATSSELAYPAAVALSPSGDLYIADSDNYVVEKVTPAGKLSIVAGVPGTHAAPTVGRATRSDLEKPTGVAVSASGDLYIADPFNDVVEQVTPAGHLSIVAGVVGDYDLPKPGLATATSVGNPGGVAISAEGDLYIADQGNNVIEKVFAP
jgi:hypothetical protein